MSEHRVRALAVTAARWGTPAIVGMAIRLYNLPAQVIYGDEFHAIRAALTKPLAQILTTYQVNDNCIPLTALFHLLIDAGVRPGEMGLRLPILLSAALFLVAAPALVARRLGVASGIVFAWLAALSPLLVLYSGLVRSYMPAVALTFLAALAFFEWLATGRRSWAAIYVVAAVLAVWFHLLCGPIVAAPLLFATGERLRGRATVSWRALAAVAGTAATGLAAFLLPAARSLAAVLASKQGGPPPGWDAWSSTLTLQAGTALPILVVTFWLFALAGALLLWRSDRRFAVYGLTLGAIHIAALLVLSPYQVRYPVIFNRYMLPVLPWTLLAVAFGLTAPLRALRQAGARGTSSLAAALVAACLPLALIIAGPLADPELRRTSFAHQDDYVLFCCPRAALADSDIPRFYTELAPGPSQPPIVEYPWSAWVSWQSLYVYQRVHRRDVLISTDEDEPRDRRLGLHNAIDPFPTAILASRGGWLVVHLDADAESRRIRQPDCAGRPRRAIRRVGLQRALRDQAQRMLERARTAWGAPDYADAAIVAWDLDRLRGAAAQARPKPQPSAASSAPGTQPTGR